jgi:hypothetical protein
MVKIKLSTEFSLTESRYGFTLNLKLLNSLGNVSIGYQKHNDGNYHLIPLNRSTNGIWEPIYAGLAAIYGFLDYQIGNDSKIIIVKVINDEATNEESETQTIETLKDKDMQIEFANVPSEDVPKELARVALKFYLLEKILKETSVEDIEQVGHNNLIPTEVELKYVTKRRKAFNDKTGKTVLRVAGFDLYSPIFYSVNFIKKDKLRIFFKSDIEKNERIIKVLYCIGTDCGNTKQRIRKTNKQNELFDNGTTVSYCSDWEINTIGDNKIIKDMSTRVAKNLSIFLDVSEQFIRSKEFSVLWEMCKTSS